MENVKQDASIGTNILRVSASDEDADNNGAITYSLSSPNNDQGLEYFEIQPESGWIVLKKPLDVSILIDDHLLVRLSLAVTTAIVPRRASRAFSSKQQLPVLRQLRFSVNLRLPFSIARCVTLRIVHVQSKQS